MIVALIDNGSLEPAAHRSLRAAAAELSRRGGTPVAAVSWKHSGRIPAAALDGRPADTLAPWMRARLAEGAREFLFLPFFVSPEGAIGSALRADLEALGRECCPFAWSVAPGLDRGDTLGRIAAERAREASRGLDRPAVVVVDHGGPSPVSAGVRDRAAEAARSLLGGEARAVAAASMESPEGDAFAFNRPLLEELLGRPGFDSGDVVVAPLFLSPGRHAGPGGDIARILEGAAARRPGLRCRRAGLVGDHPLAIDALARSLEESLSVSTPSP